MPGLKVGLLTGHGSSALMQGMLLCICLSVVLMVLCRASC